MISDMTCWCSIDLASATEWRTHTSFWALPICTVRRLKNVSSTAFQLRRQIAHNVYNIRNQHGWTQEEEADKDGLHFRHYQKVEYSLANITLDTISKLSKGLGVEAAELLKK